MPLTILDIALLVIMLMSGLLAMVRGLIRELFSIGSWLAAAAAAAVFYPQVLPFTKQYIQQDSLAMAATVGGIFLLTLFVVWIITARISDAILDSRVGALDRSLGFVFGLGRGLILMVVAFLFLTWLLEGQDPAQAGANPAPTTTCAQNPSRQPAWLRDSKSYAVLCSTGDWLKSLLPDDPEAMLKNLKKPKD
ncbi:CvpA family protein [Blastochloris viridis]|uniref:Colicin V production protein n=1 Tax=Blastochloris viridis TaxID=1079 RepID=A0A0H5B7V4_BLAVI|nr:CvpA family protein [Blastochloris viridis]ALK08458.1 colicin V production protein [Blastochloris viridis]BAR98260.1 colicin V production protein [Blastochloris viridis]CUU41120.1 Pur regulon 18 kDa protein [Blastochloris viridis]